MSQPAGFGPYELVELIGRGGMGEVWRARDTRCDRTVALKLLTDAHSREEQFRARFRREARATAALASPHVIPIHDHGEIDGRLYIDMRLVPGGDLASVLSKATDGLDTGRAIALTAQIAHALDTAHRAGLVHRDVKPSNILLEPPAGELHAYLSDFGIAKIADATTGTPLTPTSATLGTPAYMAPELFDATAGATPASDVYALGCVLYEMLTGRRPYGATTMPALIRQHVDEPIPHPSDTHPHLAPLDPVIARALAKTPDQRYPTPHTLVRALHHVVIAGSEGRGPAGAPVATGTGGVTETGGTTGTSSAESPPATRVWGNDRGTDPTSANDDRRSTQWPARVLGTGRRRTIVLATVAVLIAAGISGAVVASHAGADGEAPGITATMTTGPLAVPIRADHAESMAFSPDGRRIYILQTDTHIVSVVDVTNGHEIAQVPVPAGNGGVVVNADGTRAYISGYLGYQHVSSRLSVLDTTTNTIIGTAPTGINPEGIVLSPDGRRLYTADDGTAQVFGATVSVVDTASLALVGTIPVGLAPSELCQSADGSRLYVSELGSGVAATSLVTVIDTATGRTSSLRAGAADPDGCALSPDGRRLYLGALGPDDDGHGSIQVVDTTTGAISELQTGAFSAPFGVALTPNGRWLVVADTGTDQAPRQTVTIIDTTPGTTRQTFTLPARPVEVAVRPDGREAWVTTTEPAPRGVWRIPLP